MGFKVNSRQKKKAPRGTPPTPQEIGAFTPAFAIVASILRAIQGREDAPEVVLGEMGPDGPRSTGTPDEIVALLDSALHELRSPVRLSTKGPEPTILVIDDCLSVSAEWLVEVSRLAAMGATVTLSLNDHPTIAGRAVLGIECHGVSPSSLSVKEAAWIADFLGSDGKDLIRKAREAGFGPDGHPGIGKHGSLLGLAPEGGAGPEREPPAVAKFPGGEKVGGDQGKD